jgi:hypothetical protein
MSIGNIKNTNDLQNKKQEFAEYLQLMIDNEEIKEKRIKDYKNPNKPPPVPPQYKTAHEQSKDLMTQERLAIDNLKELGINIEEVRSFVMQLEQKQDGIDNLVKLNRNFPAFKKFISENYLAKTLDSNLLLNAWETFSSNISVITGLKSVSTNSTSAFSGASDNYKKLPNKNDLINFKDYLTKKNDVNKNGVFLNTDLSISDSLKTSLINSLDKAIGLSLDNDTISKINDSFTPLEIRDVNNEAGILLTTFKIPSNEEIGKYASFITTSYSKIEDGTGDLITLGDDINKNLITINRVLSSILGETAQKKLTQYNKFVTDKISNLYSTINKENTIPDVGPLDTELPASFFEGVIPSKIASIKTIINKKLYLDPTFIDFNMLGVDTNNLEEVRNYLSSKAISGNQLRIKLANLSKAKASEKRQNTQTRNKVGSLLDDLISQVESRDEDEKRIIAERKKAEEDKKEEELIYMSILKRYYDINPTIEEVVLLLKTLISKFVNTKPEAPQIKTYYEKILDTTTRTNDRDRLLNETINLFVVDEDAPEFLGSYINKIMSKRFSNQSKTIPSYLPKTGVLQFPLTTTKQPEKRKEEQKREPQINQNVGKAGVDFYILDDPAKDLIELNLDEKIYKEIFLECADFIEDGGDPDMDTFSGRSLAMVMRKDYKAGYSMEELYLDTLRVASADSDAIKGFLTEQYYKYKPLGRPKPKKVYETIPRTDESIGLQQAREYILSTIGAFTAEDYYERFQALKDEYPDYLYHLTDYDGRLFDSVTEFKISPKNSIESLVESVYKNELGSKLQSKINQKIKERIATENYNPKLEKFQKYPKQGFGMKKKPKKKKGGDLIHIDIGSHIGKHYKEASGKGINDRKLFAKAKKDYQSGGDQPYIKSRIKIGSGVQVEETKPKYERFGKFIIHTPQLEKNILNFKYPSEGRVPNLPRMNIDDDTKDLIFNILETGKMSENQFAKLPQHAQDHLIKAIKGAGLENILFKGKCKVYPKDEKEDRERFNVLKGEFDAGNDNPKLIKELRGLVIKFSNCGIIPKKQGLEFLTILNDI